MARVRSRKRQVHIKANGDKALYEIFKSYYGLRPPLMLPDDLESREFAFQPWGSSSYVRHLSFKSVDEIYEYLAAKVPLHAYYSLARYELPEAPSMEEKGFRGADLMFDIDADHLEGCTSIKVIDDYCIRAAGEAADRLVRILKRDFDISSVMVYFTGHRGFHIIASCEYCYYLTKEERAEIARYIAAEDLQVDMIIPTSPGNEPLVPSPEDPGWRGWLGRELMRRVDAVLLKDNKARRGRLQPTLKDALGSKWRERIVETIRRISVPIDMQVTQDTSRLVRIPGSLNGKTGLIVTPVEDPLQFRLSREVSPIRGEAVVKFQEDVEIDSLMGKSLSFKAGEEASVEAGIALILASKGLVDFVEVHGVVETHPRWRAL